MRSFAPQSLVLQNDPAAAGRGIDVPDASVVQDLKKVVRSIRQEMAEYASKQVCG